MLSWVLLLVHTCKTKGIVGLGQQAVLEWQAQLALGHSRQSASGGRRGAWGLVWGGQSIGSAGSIAVHRWVVGTVEKLKS